MLVFTRKKSERVVIAGNIIVTVVELRGDKVRLGFEMPDHVPCHREEVWLRIQSGDCRIMRSAP